MSKRPTFLDKRKQRLKVYMAAFEAVSNLRIPKIFSKIGVVDLRTNELPFERPPVDSFDPREHREPKVIIKPWMAYVNLLRATVGIGMLGAPLSISQAGMLFGPVLTFMIGILLIHTHLILLWCLNEICRQLRIPYVSYRYGFRLALLHGPPLMHCLGNCGPSVVATFMTLSQLGICSVNVIFMADNIRDIMDWESAEKSLTYMFLPLLLLEILMKNLKVISFVVTAGNLTSLLGLVIALVQVFRGPRRSTQLFPLGWVSLLLSTGTILFNVSAVGVILSCEKALVNPKIMNGPLGVVSVGLIVPTTVCSIIGSVGFYFFGVMEENVLRYLPYDETLTMVAFGMYTSVSFLTYPLACYPATSIILEVIKNHDPDVELTASNLNQAQFIARPIFVTMTFVIAYFFPFQGPFVAFVGCLCTSLMSIVFPALMEIGLCYPRYFGRWNYILMKDLLIVVLGFVIWLGGIGLCGYLLYERIVTSTSRVDLTANPKDIIIIGGKNVTLLI